MSRITVVYPAPVVLPRMVSHDRQNLCRCAPSVRVHRPVDHLLVPVRIVSRASLRSQRHFHLDALRIEVLFSTLAGWSLMST